MTAASRRTLLLGIAGLPAVGGSPTGTGPRTLIQAIRSRGSLRRFQALLAGGADPLQADSDGDTAMHHAAAARDPGYLRILLARGVSPDTPNRITGRTPLMSAMIYDHDRQFDMLLAAGARPDRADGMGNTPLHLAAQINAPGRVLALLKLGAPPLARNRQGQTFQRYLFMTSDRLLTNKARRDRQAVVAWLEASGVALEVAGQ